MNKLDIISSVTSLSDQGKIVFVFNGQRVSNRFDINGYGYQEDSKQSLISFYLYSLIGNAIILKGQGKEKSQLGEEAFKSYFSQIINKLPDDYKARMEDEKNNALRTLNSFLYDLNKVLLPELLARLAPLVVIDLACDNKVIEKKLLTYFDKNKEIIFNQAALYTRSLFHSFLTQPTTDPLKIRPDLNCLTNGLFSYEDCLVIPSEKNAFYLEGFKKAVVSGFNKVSKNYSLEGIDKIALLYLTKDLVAELVL